MRRRADSGVWRPPNKASRPRNRVSPRWIWAPRGSPRARAAGRGGRRPADRRPGAAGNAAVSPSRPGGSLAATLPGHRGQRAPEVPRPMRRPRAGPGPRAAEPQRAPRGRTGVDRHAPWMPPDRLAADRLQAAPRTVILGFERLSPLETPPARVVQPGGGHAATRPTGLLRPCLPRHGGRRCGSSAQPGVSTRRIGCLALGRARDTRRACWEPGCRGSNPAEAIGATIDQRSPTAPKVPDQRRGWARSGPTRPGRSEIDDGRTVRYRQPGAPGPGDSPAGREPSLAAHVTTPPAGTLSSITSDPLQPDVAVAPRIGSHRRKCCRGTGGCPGRAG